MCMFGINFDEDGVVFILDLVSVGIIFVINCMDIMVLIIIIKFELVYVE